MTITVLFTTQLKASIGKSSDQVQFDGPVTVAEVLSALSGRYGADFRDLVLRENGEILPSILLCLGDEQIDPSCDQALSDGDVLTLLSAISGG